MIDKELVCFLDDWAAAWAEVPADASFEERRSILERIAEGMRPPLPRGIESSVAYVPDGRRPVRVRIFRPLRSGPTACVVYMHGGGWVQGSPETHQDIAAGIAGANGQTVISVDYSLAPERPFPAAPEDCRLAVEWVFDHAAALGVLASKIVVAGDSAGANLAAATALALRNGARKLTGQLLFYPTLDFSFDRPSFFENAGGPLLTAEMMRGMAQMYVPNPADRNNPLAAPLMAPDLRGMPPAFVAVAEHDPLRDDGIEYAERLRGCGVAVDVNPGRGLFHGYLRAMSYGGAVSAVFDEACAWLRTV